VFNSESDDSHEQLSAEELRTVVNESGERLPRPRQGMLLNILDLEHVTVNDILVPRNEILGIDIEDDIDEILSLIGSSQHTRMPVYKKEIDNLIGILHLRSVGKLIRLWKPSTRQQSCARQSSPITFRKARRCTYSYQNFRERNYAWRS